MYSTQVKDGKKFDTQRDARLKPELLIEGDEVLIRVVGRPRRQYSYREYLGVIRTSPVGGYQYVLDTVNSNGREFAIPLNFTADGMLISAGGNTYGYALEPRVYAQFDKNVSKPKPRSESSRPATGGSRGSRLAALEVYLNPLLPSAGGAF